MSVRADPPPELYRPVLDAPDDDGPRLACADWFEAHGQAQRARLVRAQCEAARLPPGDQRAWPLENEANALVWQNRKAWLGGRPDPKGVRWFFLRGFAEHVEFDSFKALEETRAAVFRFPVRRMSFNNLRSIARLARCDVLASVRELDLSRCNLRDEGVATLAASPYLHGLTWLDLGGNGVRADGVAALAGAARLTSLTHLELHSRSYNADSNVAGAPGARSIANWPGLANLRYLGLDGCGVGDEGLAALAASPHLRDLTGVDLGNNGLTPAGLAALADAAAWPRLRLLRLKGNRVGDEGAGELARCAHWPDLSALDLNQARVGDLGARALAAAPQFSSLQTLDLNHNAVGNAGAAALASSPHLGALVSLQLGGNLVGDEGGWALGRSASLASLRSLMLGGNALQRALEAAVCRRFAQQDPGALEGLKLQETLSAPAELAPPPPLPRTAAFVDEAALWQAIADDPDDDLPRLVYADWLDDNAQPERAELIRLQCDPARHEPAARERELIERHRAAWLGPLAPHAQSVRFERGLARVAVSMRSFLTKAFQTSGADWLRDARAGGLEILGSTRDWGKVAASPVLAAAHELYLTGSDVGRAALPALARSPDLAALHTLSVRDTYLYSASLTEFLDVGRLPRLRRLMLDSAGVRLDHLQVLARWPGSSRLTTLSLRRNWLTPADASVLFNSPAFAALRHLDLYYNGVRDNGVRALCAAEGLPALRGLDLGFCNVGNDGAAALADSPILGQLTELSLANNPIGEAGALALAGSPRAGKLRWLALTVGGLSDGCVAEVRRLLGEGRLRGQRYRG